DPLPEILQLREEFGFRLHADAAYGGYFVLAENLAENARRSFARIGEADSIVIDPHKHGLQPYGCGCVLFRDPAVGRLYKHDSPYTYFSSADLHLGEISLECSRPGASAAALWATQKLLPLVRGGEFAKGLEKGRSAALKFWQVIDQGKTLAAAFEPELDILCFVPRGGSLAEISSRSRRIFEAAARNGLHLAVAELPVRFWKERKQENGRDTVTCLRSVLMKPDHLEWVEAIVRRLDQAVAEVR
ncbi:MAG TPA: pyridoxal-dependent decarboxylase, partial [Candidatus Acidoferrum sp.]|nr:pyridoxal-dependent decarboxylase [Candidatus Acidoferrum sp.]